jgi:transcriptional regulator with XRE-family HTH domain
MYKCVADDFNGLLIISYRGKLPTDIQVVQQINRLVIKHRRTISGEDLNMLLMDRIKFLRLLKGMAQYDLVEKNSTRQSSMLQLESKDKSQKEASLQKIALALDTTPEWLTDGTAPVFTKSLLIADPVPDKLTTTVRSGIIADLKDLLSSFFAANYVSECVSILVSPRVIVNILYFPEGSLLILPARNRAVKIIQSAVKRSGCACSFLDLSKSNFDINCLLQQQVEQGAESLRELLSVAAAVMSNPLDVDKYIKEYRDNAQQDSWGFCLTAYVRKKGGLTREQAVEALHKLVSLTKGKDAQIEISQMI